jgi:hypothetical protein
MTKRSSKVFQGMFLSRFNAQVMYRKVDGEVKPRVLSLFGSSRTWESGIVLLLGK